VLEPDRDDYDWIKRVRKLREEREANAQKHGKRGPEKPAGTEKPQQKPAGPQDQLPEQQR
jgi:hypothetical protein